jgi:hypothetical protein
LYSVLRLLPKGRETDFHDQYDITVIIISIIIISSSMHNAPACKRLSETKADYIHTCASASCRRPSVACAHHPPSVI